METDRPVVSALEELVPRIRAVVRAHAGALDVDDLTQECCVRLIEKEHLYRSDRGGLTHWVDQVARRFVRSRRQRDTRRQEIMSQIQAPESVEQDFSDDRVEWVLTQMAGLPPSMREVLHLKYYENLNLSEVGERLGISQPAASKRLKKALNELNRRARLQGLLSIFLPYGLSLKIAGVSKMKLYTALGLSVATLGTACGFFLPSADTHFIGNTSNLKHTTMADTLEAPLDANTNTIWTATSNLAWDKLTKQLGGAVMFDVPKPMAKRLNGAHDASKDLSDEAYVALAGHVADDAIEKAQAKLIEKFGRGRDPVLDQLAKHTVPESLISYAFLAKDLTFKQPFDILADKPLTFQAKEISRKVETFGIYEYDPTFERDKKLIEQLEINYARPEKFVERKEGVGHDYIPPSYVITLKPEQNDDIILAMIEPGRTLKETVNKAIKKLSANEEVELKEGKSVKIPKFDFHLTHEFKELYSGRLTNPGYEGWFFSKALQTVAFKLDEKGVVLRTRTYLQVDQKLAPFNNDIVFDRPFLLMLREKGAKNPYFAMWIAHPELLILQK